MLKAKFDKLNKKCKVFNECTIIVFFKSLAIPAVFNLFILWTSCYITHPNLQLSVNPAVNGEVYIYSWQCPLETKFKNVHHTFKT